MIRLLQKSFFNQKKWREIDQSPIKTGRHVLTVALQFKKDQQANLS